MYSCMSMHRLSLKDHIQKKGEMLAALGTEVGVHYVPFYTWWIFLYTTDLYVTQVNKI